eukprot:7607140-Pyramimonas_sp.AAC.1
MGLFSTTTTTIRWRGREDEDEDEDEEDPLYLLLMVVVVVENKPTHSYTDEVWPQGLWPRACAPAPKAQGPVELPKQGALHECPGTHRE